MIVCICQQDKEEKQEISYESFNKKKTFYKNLNILFCFKSKFFNEILKHYLGKSDNC